jgi:hypothetical protein
MEIGIIIILAILGFIGYVVVQETRAQMHWRGLVEGGDVNAIRELVQDEIEHWHTARVPRGVPALLWHGIQTVELIDVDATGVRVSCSAEGESALIEGRRVESSTPLEEGKKITMKLAEMLLYDVPNVKLDRVQVDVYTSFRDAEGRAEARCVLSTLVERSAVEHIDWEELAPAEFVELTRGRFVSGSGSQIRPIEPLGWAGGATRSS